MVGCRAHRNGRPSCRRGLVSPLGAPSGRECHRGPRASHQWVAHRQGGGRERPRTAHDHGTLHDHRHPGVCGGWINASGVLEIRGERIGRDTSYGRIIEAVERAERSRAPVQRLADQLAAYLVYFALGAAALTFLLTRDMHSTIAVVIVAGACGVAAGTPLAILGGIGRAARLGAIIKGGVPLEALGRVDTGVLDKTGTLTYGQPA